MTPNPVIGGNNYYHDSSNISSRNQTESFNFGKKQTVTKLRSKNLVISKVRKKGRSVGRNNQGLNSSFIKKNKQK